jgi:hypothetical protein
MILIPMVLDGAAGWESGESVSLLSRTPKARASRQFLECNREAVAFGQHGPSSSASAICFSIGLLSLQAEELGCW